MLMVTAPEAATRRCGGQVGGEETGECKEVCLTADLEIGRGYGKQVRGSAMTAQPVGAGLGPGEGAMARRDPVMSQQSVRQAVRRSALDAQEYGVRNVPNANAGSRVWRSR